MPNISNEKISFFIYKVLAAENFVRMIEWKQMLNYLDPKKEEKILDVACGKGMLSIRIAKNGSEVYGIDLSEHEIDHANYISIKEKIHCDFDVCNAEKLYFPDNFFDKIICSSALEHFENDVLALKQMNRVLKEKGTIVLSVDSLSYPIDDTLKEMHKKRHHVVNYYSLDNLSKKLKSTGFLINESNYELKSPISSYLYNLMFIKSAPNGNVGVVRFIGMIISIIVYPICLISDTYFKKDNVGYTLIIKGRKKP